MVLVPFFMPGASYTGKKGAWVVRCHKVLSVRLSGGETKQLEQLARDKELTISELVRIWLEQASRQAWREGQQGKEV
jgi:hypothetical protein